MSDNPYDRIREARDEIVAGSMAAAHDLITEAIEGVTSIRMNNNDEGGIYWSYRTADDPDGEWIDVESERTASGEEDLHDALYDQTIGIGLDWTSHVEPYLAVRVGTETYGYGPSMPVDKYDGEFVHADLDIERMHLAWQPYEKGYDEDLGKILLVYRDEAGDLHEQPIGDINEAGTLIDPESGDDMELVGWKRA